MTVITPCRPATPDETPKMARRLATLAEANGWEVAITYTRGEWPAKTPKVIDNVAVRMWREGKLAAVWHDGKFHRGLSRSRTYTLTELRRMVAMTRAEQQAWQLAKATEAVTAT